MKTGMLRRKRLDGGGFGELEKVMSGETAEERMNRIEAESAAALNAVIMLFEQSQPAEGSGTNE